MDPEINRCCNDIRAFHSAFEAISTGSGDDAVCRRDGHVRIGFSHHYGAGFVISAQTGKCLRSFSNIHRNDDQMFADHTNHPPWRIVLQRRQSIRNGIHAGAWRNACGCLDCDPAVRSVSVHAGGNDVKKTFILSIMILCSCLFSFSSYAVSGEEILDLDAFESAQPAEALDAFGSLNANQLSEPQSLLGKLWNYISGQISEWMGSSIRNGAQVLFISFFSVLCCAMSDSRIISWIGASSVSLVCIKSVFSCAAVGGQALQTLTDYSHVLLPCLSTAAAASGAWTSAGVKYAVSSLVMDMIITTEQTIAVPFLYTYASASIAAQLTEQPLLISVSGIMKQMMKWVLIILTTGFTVYLSVTGLMSGTVDAAAAKAAKTVISSALPVVGSILADASGAILSGVQMLRNGIGLIGLFVILAVCASPYLTLGSHYLVYQICAGISASFGDKKVGNVIRCIGEVYGFLLGMVGSVSIMLFVSVISLMKTVNPG